MNYKHLLYFLIIITCSCASPPKYFNSPDVLEKPNYSNEKNWAALPFRKDKADRIPNDEEWIHDSLKKVDVFYVYPTFYTKGKTWNADINKKRLNRRIARYPLRLQSTPFNRVGRVYAPYYRQAMLDSYFDTTGIREQTLELAYQDVKDAFEYFLEHYNKGRPIIIASHSQGSEHCRRLLREYFDDTERKKQLVAAYVVGISIYSAQYDFLYPCENPEEINCYVTWASYKKDFFPNEKNVFSKYLLGDVCVNPVSWKMDKTLTTGQGAFLTKIGKKRFDVKCQVRSNYLWVDTNMMFFKRKQILHTIDYNLFWHDIRKNVQVRVDEYFRKKRSVDNIPLQFKNH